MNRPKFTPYVVIMEDPIEHDSTHIFCQDPSCPCHEDEAAFLQYIRLPLDLGELTTKQALDRFFGKQVQ